MSFFQPVVSKFAVPIAVATIGAMEVVLTELVEDHSDFDEILGKAIRQDNTPQLNTSAAGHEGGAQ